MGHFRRPAALVGPDVHTYDASYRPQYRSQIPAMRSPHDVDVTGFSATPIYDALYSEYRRSFRTLPGDRSGEESLQFKTFAMMQNDPVFQGQGRHRGALPAALPPGGYSSAPRIHGVWSPERTSRG
jgi:hypothetical protein